MTIPMRSVVDIDDEKPGAFSLCDPGEFNKGRIYFVCPNGRSCTVAIRRGEFQKLNNLPRWGWDGNAEKPTLTPSINCSGSAGCGWHGHFVNGEMKDA